MSLPPRRRHAPSRQHVRPPAGTAPAGDTERRAALFVLRHVRRGGSWEEAWRRVTLPDASRERRFALDLAGGVLRLRGRLDALLAPRVTGGLSRLDDDVLDILRLGAFQLFESHVPDHAAVSTSVDLTRGVSPAAAGLVNAVLRRLQRREDAARIESQQDPVDFLVSWGSHPEWMVRRWLDRFGFETTRALCAYDNARPHLRLRVNRCRTSRQAVLEQLPGSVAGTWSPWSVDAAASGWAAVAPLLQAGLVSVQDESGVVIGDACAARPGQTWMDVAASPGGKAGCLAEALDGQGRVLAFDVTEAKVERLRQLPARLGFTNIDIACADVRTLPPQQVDGVLLDAPCSGLGVLGRRPDARWRKQPEDLPRLAALQLELLQAAARHVRPGGALVYSVCSFEPEETREVAQAFQRQHPQFEPDPPAVPDALQTEPGVLYLLPQEHGTDGGFTARWRRRAG